ncbi:MAG: aminodeoxychorismate synthase component I [Armatimonadetes bacterium]|nr:aminodeoxychorismate synthase component I [Armatimonadota bacterium]MDW8028751.1 aminodeoxychorismate synthase component I [Armatimonadota bacterium]
MLRFVELPYVSPQEAYKRLPLEIFGTIVLHSGHNPLPDHPYPLARYCFFLTEPFVQISFFVGKPFVRIVWQFGSEQKIFAHPFLVMRDFWRAMKEKLHQLPDLPTTLPCGLVGYLSYDLRVTLEKVPFRSKRDIEMPDFWMGAYASALTWDLQERKLYATATGLPESGKEADKLANERIGQLIAWLVREQKHEPTSDFIAQVPLFTDMTKDEYFAAVERIKAYIATGDVYQVNFAHRFRTPVCADPPSLFLRLCQVNPAPFAAFLNLGDVFVLCSSPERFLHFDPLTRIAHTRPIKGTRPRGETEYEDEILARELIESEKDKAEHIMIVDLERNDLGRVAEVGSVCVSKLFQLELHPTVWHLVSTVESKIPKGKDLADLLFAMFPGGSITGAPKIRAMEIIDEVEPVARGIYTGSIGYWSFSGHCDFNIVIRTAVLKEGMAYFHAGGGIVADSEAEAEYEETIAKAKGLAKMLGCGLS